MRFISTRTFAAFAGLTLLAGAVAAPVLAQTTNSVTPQTNVGQHHKGGGDNWATKLNLTEAQKAQIKSIREAEKNERQSVFTPDQLNQLSSARQNHTRPNLNLTDAQKQQLHAIRQKYAAQFKALLTPEQQQQLSQLKAQHQGRHHNGAGTNNQ
jgi:Spy/CpxP family protein refolding chaperone